MEKCSRRRWMAALTTAAVLGYLSPVWSQTPQAKKPIAEHTSSDDPWASAAKPKAPADERKSLHASLRGQAQLDFDDALQLMRAGNFEAALFKLTQAYDASREPRLLFNMAGCYARLGRNVRARALMRQYRYEALAVASLPPEELAEVDKFIASYDSIIGRAQVEVDQPGATIRIEGQEVGKSPLAEPVEVEEGERTILISKDGFRDASVKIVVHGGGALTTALVKLAPRQGRLVVVPKPSKAAVRVDSKLGGVGTFDATLPTGPHHVAVSAEGMVARSLDVTVVDGQTRALEVALDRQHDGKVWWWIGGGLAAVTIVAVTAAVIATSNHEAAVDGRSAPAGTGAIPLVRF